MNHNNDNLFYKLLRLSLGLPQEFPVDIDAPTWRHLYQTTVRQSLIGVCYQGLCLLPEGCRPPMEIVMQWASEAETIKGMNELFNQESARLTRLFDDAGRRTAILKGQANARLYPDKLSRLPGDIDIWVEGGRESVLALLQTAPFASMTGNKNLQPSSHHENLHTKNKVEVEVHFHPSSGNYNPFTSKRMLRWLETEILSTVGVEEGFLVPSVRFALVMQLSHIQRHFIAVGIGLRQICDYFMLLKNASAEDRQMVADHLKCFGLRHTAGALMWVLGEVLQMDRALMICEPDNYRGEWMLREIMAGGNFGQYADRMQHGRLRRKLEKRWRQLRMIRFDSWEVVMKGVPR